MKIGNKELAIGISLLFALLSSMLFGATGVLALLVMGIAFYLPLYFIIQRIDLEPEEKIFYPFFIGIGVIPTLVYWLGTLVSFRLSIVVIVVLLAGFGWFMPNKKG
ncbi:MAG TPA: hypothetical protein VJI46_03415 [Candidatus Nanoarchaeia archaeon]|nr:hypothetical protein [Candidatus Nanoarchaeia archaeon]